MNQPHYSRSSHWSYAASSVHHTQYSRLHESKAGASSLCKINLSKERKVKKLLFTLRGIQNNVLCRHVYRTVALDENPLQFATNIEEKSVIEIIVILASTDDLNYLTIFAFCSTNHICSTNKLANLLPWYYFQTCPHPLLLLIYTIQTDSLSSISA